MFELDQKVTTPNGVGTVSYVEDGYIEVTVAGNEFSFEAPFSELAEYVDPEQVLAGKIAADFAQEVKAEFIINNLSGRWLLKGRKLHAEAILLTSIVGGSATPWDQLSNVQKLNYVAVGHGLTSEILINEFDNERATIN